MTEAKKSAQRRIRQLKRQKMAWFYENARDQGEYLQLLKEEATKEDEIQSALEDLAAIRARQVAKATEMVGENKTQMQLFDQMIEEVEKEYASL